ncbi:MAG TPA: MalY/PatB family protein [Holophaga sp.]|nr:MalY/PatB family protein [Holophaga sp.]HPS66899.1 MalY/PatB family protein [Holophaga sp.]
MMHYDFDTPYERRGTRSFKWDYNDKYFGAKDVLPFWASDMDLPCAEPIVSALRSRVEHRIYGYTERSSEFREAIVHWLKERHAWQVDPDWLVFCPPGIIPAIDLLLDLKGEPGSGVVMQTPGYQPLADMAGRSHRVVLNPLAQKGADFELDFDHLETCFNPGTRMMVWCSPHSPTGRVWTLEELGRVAEICSRKDVFVVSDEIFADLLLFGHHHHPFGSLPGDAGYRSATCISAGKTFNISGLLLATLIIQDPALREAFNRRLSIIQMTQGNLFGEEATLAAYQHGREWLDQVLRYVEGNVQFVRDFSEAYLPDVQVTRPQGTYNVWMDMTRIGKPAGEMNRLMAHEVRVALSEGRNYGMDTACYRMSLACPRTYVEMAMSRMRTHLGRT